MTDSLPVPMTAQRLLGLYIRGPRRCASALREMTVAWLPDTPEGTVIGHIRPTVAADIALPLNHWRKIILPFPGEPRLSLTYGIFRTVKRPDGTVLLGLKKRNTDSRDAQLALGIDHIAIRRRTPPAKPKRRRHGYTLV